MKELSYDPETEMYFDDDGQAYSEDEISRLDAYWEAQMENTLEGFGEEAREEALKTYENGCYCNALGMLFGDCGYCKLAERIYLEKKKQWEESA